jgi:hypothetical protein
MAIKPHYDVEKSLSLRPPKKFTGGSKHKKRIVLNRSKVTFPLEENSRELTVIQDGVSSIKDSFLVNGWLHDAYPPIVYEDPNKKDSFIGISGFHRNAAMDQLDWDTMMVDVFEFPSPLSITIAKAEANHHNKPFTPITKRDIEKQVLRALKNKEIPNTEDDVRNLVEILAAIKTPKERKKIFQDVMKRNGGNGIVRTYHTGQGESSTQEIAEELKLPFSGSKHFQLSGEYGYINSSDTPKTTLHDAKKLSMANGNVKVALIAFIDKPVEEKINAQRQAHKARFEQFIREDAEFVLSIVKQFGLNANIDDVVAKYPLYLKGFLPQLISPDETKGGRPKEETLVDANGKFVK